MLWSALVSSLAVTIVFGVALLVSSIVPKFRQATNDARWLMRHMFALGAIGTVIAAILIYLDWPGIIYLIVLMAAFGAAVYLRKREITKNY